MISARAMHAGLQALEPVFTKSDIQFRSKLLIGSVRGDLHDIGKHLASLVIWNFFKRF